MEKRFSELEARVKAAEAERDNLKRQVDRFTDEQPPDRCPFCRRLAGEIVDLQPDEYAGEAGFKRAYYKCSSCGKKYDKRVDP